MLIDPPSFAIIASLLIRSAPVWLTPIREAFLNKVLDKGSSVVFDQGAKSLRGLFQLDEKEQTKHLELVLKNALERGQAKFLTAEEKRQYRDIITTLCEPGAHRETLLREVMRLFSLFDTPSFQELNDIYYSSLPPSTTGKQVDAAVYLNSFFDALIAELYADPYFRQQMSDALSIRAAMNMQRSLAEVVETLRQIGESLADTYTLEQFERDLFAYTVGVVPKERENENRDPELDGIFIPLSLGLYRSTSRDKQKNTVVDLLEQTPCIVLLGGPGTGKSTSTRYLAWSHAVANMTKSTSTSTTSLLSGKPLPVRIELRRLHEDRQQHPEYDFLSYISNVLLGREGLDIARQMFVELLDRRMMLVLFDGLDEVATLDERHRLVGEIENFARHHPGNRFLATSRPVGYELAPLSEEVFTHVVIQPFDDHQIHLFLEKWYTHVLRLFPLSSDDRVDLEELYTTLKGNRRLHSLAENPLLLTAITAIHRYERLPDKRVQVYDRCADLLLETWAKLRGTSVRWSDLKLTKEDQYACVAHLGFVLHERMQQKPEYESNQDTSEGIAVDVPARFMLREIEQFLLEQNLFSSKAEQRTQAKRFLDLIKEEAGLIVERGTDENGESLFGFVHRTFQEYFSAADVYERYQQEENSEIISSFLREHLHDPYWNEVILPLFGKLKRKPATVQLRQILESKLLSQRSQYTSILQQDLFFVGSCLAEEISVENDLVVSIVSQFSKLIQNSLFPSQRNEALQALDTLIRTRQYALPVQQALKELIIHDQEVDIPTKIEAAIIFFQGGTASLEDQQLAFSLLLTLAQKTGAPLLRLMAAAEKLYFSRSTTAERQQLMGELLLALAKRSDLPLEQFTAIIQKIYRAGPEGQLLSVQLLLVLAERPHLTAEQSFLVAQNLYQFSPRASRERQTAGELLLQLVQHSNLPVKQFIQLAQRLYRFSTRRSEEESLAVQLLLSLTQRPDLSIEQLMVIAQTLYQSTFEGSREERLARQLVLTLAQRPDLSIEQTIAVAQQLNDVEGYQLARQLLLTLAQRSGLSIEQTIAVAQQLYQASFRDVEGYQLARQLLLTLAQRPDLSVEQSILTAQTLYRISSEGSEEESLAIQSLVTLAQRPDLSIEQFILATQNLYHLSSVVSEERHVASRLLLTLAQRADLSIEQSIQIAQNLNMLSPDGSEERKLSLQLLIALAQRPDLPTEQSVLTLQTLYHLSPADSTEQQFAIQSLLALAQRPDFPTEQSITTLQILYQLTPRGSEERQLTRRLFLTLIQRLDLPINQFILAIQALYQASPRGSEDEPLLVTQLLQALSQRPNLSIEQSILIARYLYQFSHERSGAQRQAVHFLLGIAQNGDIASNLRLSAVAESFSTTRMKYSERLQAIQMAFMLLDTDAIGHFFEEHWSPIDEYVEPQISDLPALSQLVMDARLPIQIRDEFYQILRRTVPQINW